MVFPNSSFHLTGAFNPIAHLKESTVRSANTKTMA
jgi:hypothetical protein